LKVAEIGFSGVGVDISPGMLNRAKDKLMAYDFELIEADICTVKIGRKFPLAICFFDTVNHIKSKKKLADFIANAREHLEESGLFVFDFLTPEALKDWEGSDITSKEGFLVIVKGKYIPSKGRALINIEGFIETGGNNYKRFSQFIEQRGITINEMLDHLARSGFGNVSMRGFYNNRELEEGGRILVIAN